MNFNQEIRIWTLEYSFKNLKANICAYVCVCACAQSRFSHVRLLMTIWTVARHAPLSTGFSRQGYWNGLPWAPLGDLPNPGIKPTSLTLALAGGFYNTSKTWKQIHQKKKKKKPRTAAVYKNVCLNPSVCCNNSCPIYEYR